MKVCYFGMYKAESPRNRLFIAGLKENGIIVRECCQKSIPIIGASFLLLIINFILHYRDIDVIFVAFPGHNIMPLAWLLSKIFRKKIVFDVFLSQYDTLVDEKKLYKPGSLKARYYWWQDKISCCLADILIVDTNQTCRYFQEKFGISKDKFRRIFVSTDDKFFYPRKQIKNKKFIAEFHGKFLPLSGTIYVVKAAKLLSKYPIEFHLLGNGTDRPEAEGFANKWSLEKVKFIDNIPYEEVPNFINAAQVCLGGPFGNSDKSRKVIAFKSIEGIAMGIATIVGDTKATRELFTNEKDCLMVRLADPPSLAAAILRLYKDKSLRDKLAFGGERLFKQKLTSEVIGEEVSKIVLSVC